MDILGPPPLDCRPIVEDAEVIEDVLSGIPLPTDEAPIDDRMEPGRDI
jgi:hypothetical protein